MNHTPIFITDTEIDSVLTYDMARTALKKALIAHTRHQVDQPLKVYLRPGGRDNEYECGRVIAMPAYIGGDINAIGLKWISSVPNNINHGLPRASGIFVLNDVKTGRPLAIMECATLSARRTGAVASLCWESLGTPGDTICIIGCGPVNMEVVYSLNALNKPIREFRIFDLNNQRAMEFKGSIEKHVHCKVTVLTDLEDCLRGGNTVIMATMGSKGYIKPEWLNGHKLIIPLSLDDCQAQTLLSATKIVVDDFDQCNREEKLFHHLVRDGKLRRDQIYAELGEIISGAKVGRQSDEIIYCNLMGMAIEDLSVGKAIYDKITEKR